MVEERRELHLPIPTCGLTYPLQLMWHADPALRPAHGLLVRIALGQTSSLHRLRWLRGSRKRMAGAVGGGFVGTTRLSDFPCPFIVGLRP